MYVQVSSGNLYYFSLSINAKTSVEFMFFIFTSIPNLGKIMSRPFRSACQTIYRQRHVCLYCGMPSLRSAGAPRALEASSAGSY